MNSQSKQIEIFPDMKVATKKAFKNAAITMLHLCLFWLIINIVYSLFVFTILEFTKFGAFLAIFENITLQYLWLYIVTFIIIIIIALIKFYFLVKNKKYSIKINESGIIYKAYPSLLSFSKIEKILPWQEYNDVGLSINPLKYDYQKTGKRGVIYFINIFDINKVRKEINEFRSIL